VEVGLGPGRAVGEQLRAGGAAAADGADRVGGVAGHAVELGDRQVAVEVVPQAVGAADAPDAAIAADDDLVVGVHRHRVEVGVRAVGVAVGRDVAPGFGRAAVGGHEDHLRVRGAAALLAADVHGALVHHLQGGVVLPLVGHVVRRGRHLGPALAAGGA